MARRDLLVGPDRLAAVLRPWPNDRAAAPAGGAGTEVPDDDAPTAPLPVPPGRRPGRLARLVERWLPRAWRTARLDPGRPGALALLLTAAVAAVLAAVGVWREAPRAEPVADLPALVDATSPSSVAAPAAPPGPAPTPGPPPPLVVAVAGKVARPGLVRVPAGARVADVLEAAGGALPGADLAGVNLARKVSDGEQVAVGVPAATDAAPPTAPATAPATAEAGGAATGSPLDLNTASVAELDALPGVGPVTAQRIVEWRSRNGRFASVDQLREVEGIGERRFAQLRELVRV